MCVELGNEAGESLTVQCGYGRQCRCRFQKETLLDKTHGSAKISCSTEKRLPKPVSSIWCRRESFISSGRWVQSTPLAVP